MGGRAELLTSRLETRLTLQQGMSASDDQDLVRRMLGGGEQAFADLYSRHQRPVFRFVVHMTGSIAIAEDVTQEVFLALIEHGRGFQAARGNLRSFLLGIARNHVLRRWAKERATDQEPEEFDVACEADTLHDLTRQETIEGVRRAVLSLPPAYREAVVLCDLEDASYEEAAAILACPVGTVRSRISRGREMLVRKLACLAEARSA